MRFVPTAISRKVASQALLAKKNSPTILFGAGVASMVGSTVLACRATLKLEEVLDEIENSKNSQELAKEKVDNGDVEGVTYTDEEFKQDSYLILVKGGVKIVKLYAPSLILGGVGVVCLTKSHRILKERNTALAAAYFAVDTAFSKYRERVVERYGKDVDRELRYGSEEIDVIDEETGKVLSTVCAADLDPGMYARWFDQESSANWSAPPYDHYNKVFLMSQQNIANDLLHSRGHITLNEVYGMLGLSHTSAGAVVGWIYSRDNERGDNRIDFGCWDDNNQLNLFNGRDGAILLDFNVDGNIWELIDDSVARNS